MGVRSGVTDELHWSDPEFLQWEQDQVGEYREVVMDLDHYDEDVTYFRCDRGPGIARSSDSSTNYAGCMFSLKRTDVTYSADQAEYYYSQISDERLKEAVR